MSKFKGTKGTVTVGDDGEIFFGEIEVAQLWTDEQPSNPMPYEITIEEMDFNAKLFEQSKNLLDCVNDALSDLSKYMSEGQKTHFKKIVKFATE